MKSFNFINTGEQYTVSGSFPLDLGIVNKEAELDMLPLNIMITGKSKNLNILTSNIENIDYLNGDISLQLSKKRIFV